MTIQTTLGELRVDNSHTLDPSKFAGQAFDLYSVPSHETGQPEVAQAEAIGSAKRTTAPGTVLLCKINPRINRVWVVGPKNGLPQIASTEWIQFGPTDGLEPAYLAWYMRQQWVRDHLAANASGVGGSLMRVRPKILDDIPINIPPVGEQRRIVAEIDEQLSRLEAGVAALKRVQANLKRYRAAALAEITHIDNKALPAGWHWSSVGELARVGTGATPKRDRRDYWQGGTVPWVTSGVANQPIVTEPTEFITETALQETNCKVYPPGTLLVAMYGEGKTRGMCTELAVPAATNQALAAIQTTEKLRPFLKRVLQASYERTRGVASGGVQPNLNLSHVRAIRVPLPPPHEQQELVEEIDRRLSVIDELETQITADFVRAERLKQLILQQAFSTTLSSMSRN